MVHPVKLELAKLRMRNARPDDDQLIFPAHDGNAWQEDDWRNRRRRVFGTFGAPGRAGVSAAAG